jgi:uncharacterized surface anchored protein
MRLVPFCILIGAGGVMYAQSIGASLSGIVLDSNQAAVEGADVEVANRDTGALRRLSTGPLASAHSVVRSTEIL